MAHSRSNLRITRNHDLHSDPSLDAIRDRLKAALKGESCRTIGHRTGTHPETVRRYLSSGHPSVEFLGAVARGYDISCNWLLLGAGPVKPQDTVDHVFQTATLSRLLRGVAEKLAVSEGQADGQLGANGARLRMTESPARDISRRTRLVSSLALLSTST
ncbi:MAG: hypothetical protein ACREJD_01850 [Phycisphaerales bacterium]